VPPTVSVCLDVFNYRKYLPRAIESVLAQRGVDWELVIADDCSTDGSWEAAARFADPRIRLIQNERNLGMVRNRNVALRAARGRFVKPLHADDFLLSPDALARMSAQLETNPAASLVASPMQFVNQAGEAEKIWASFDGRRMVSGTGVIVRCLSERRNLIGGPSAVMFRRDRAGRGFDETFFHMADLEMWFHLLEQGCFAFVPEPLCAYRRHASQQTERDRGTFVEFDDYDALLARYLDADYLRLKPWVKAHLRRAALVSRNKRCRALGLPASEISISTRVSTALLSIVFRQMRAAKRWLEKRSRPAPSRLPVGINVAGFFETEHGIGESSRAFGRAMVESGLPCAFINIRSREHRNEAATDYAFSRTNPFRVNLMTFSFDYARRFYRDAGRRFFAGRWNIALWYWELERLPPRWHECFDYYDEIWVATEFCRQAIAAVSPIPVTKVTYPFRHLAGSRDRPAFGLAEEDFIFLVTFDHLSLVDRKNPLGAIAAFREAFPPDERAVLVIKSINAHRDPAGRERLHAAVGDARVVFLEHHMSVATVAALFASADACVSLHRSEGFGLGLAQAMAAGLPVVATGWSGNMEFMTAQNSLPVRFELVEIGKTIGPYPRGYRWADPQISHAAELMRGLFNDHAAAMALGKRAAADIQRRLDPALTQREVRARLSALNLLP
jgi:glycosyltransferase involved in cell wall biosynthesis